MPKINMEKLLLAVRSNLVMQLEDVLYNRTVTADDADEVIKDLIARFSYPSRRMVEVPENIFVE